MAKLQFLLVLLIFLAGSFMAGCGGNASSLAKPGQYDFGSHEGFEFVDSSRGGRLVKLIVWYPAKLPANAPSSTYNFDAPADRSGAPYPVILSSGKVANIFGAHLASHGFVMVGVMDQDSWSYWDKWLVDYPLDLLFALERVAEEALPGLEGMADASRAGAMGYSFDSFTSLVLSGARFDFDYYQSKCAGGVEAEPRLSQVLVDYYCKIPSGREDFIQSAGTAITAGDDGLWQPISDDRILAVMPMGPEGAWMFGERGLAAVNRPTLLIAAEKDDINVYSVEAAFLYNHISHPGKGMITFLGQDHMMIYDADAVTQMKFFATAFFGYHLQRIERYEQYVSQRYVDNMDGFAWGVTGEP